MFRACPIKEKFGPFSDLNSLRQLDDHLLDKSYLVDCMPTQLDAACYKLVSKVDFHNFDHISRWASHLATFTNEFEFLPKADFS